MPEPIENYAIIGDCRSAALIGKSGSIDWLCLPRFDSDTCFAALLGTPEHGRWLVAPAEAPTSITRRYDEVALVLRTEFQTATGRVALTDFMPMRSASQHVIRIVEGLEGRVPMRMELVLRFDYGASIPWVTSLSDGDGLEAVAGPNRVILRTTVPVRGEGKTSVSDFIINAGDTVQFTLSYGSSFAGCPERLDVQDALAETRKAWAEWLARSQYDGEWKTVFNHSLMILKALTYEPTGGIVAAATTSLPEKLGGVRNWDYRYCWLRDSTLTLLALMNAGYHDEAVAWRRWLLRAVAGSPEQVQIMYGLAGERRLPEVEIPWLPGYQGAQPVRIGNAASSQLQLDVYGEVVDTLHHARLAGLPADEVAWSLQRALVTSLEGAWQQPDHGNWEVRGERRNFTYSKIMAWVAFDRAIKTAECTGLDAPLERWRTVRQRIHDEVCSKAFDSSRGTFVQSYGSNALDASLLLIPQSGFLSADDVRVRGTVAAVERELLTDGFLLRYSTSKTDDGLPPEEGAFIACSFWLADAYVLQGRLDDGRRLFERLLGVCNDVGLLSEEYDVATGRQLGNMPQAFSHIALINTAMNLTRASGPVHQRAKG